MQEQALNSNYADILIQWVHFDPESNKKLHFTEVKSSTPLN